MENSESLVRTCVRRVKVSYVLYDGKPDGLNALCALANETHEGNYYTVITKDNGHYIRYASLSGDEGMFLVGEDKPVIVLDKFIKAMTMEEFNKLYRSSEDDNRERIFRARVHMEADLRIDLPGESKDQVRGNIDSTFVDTFREAMKGAYGGRVDVVGVGGKVEGVTELVKQTITVEK